MKTPAVVIVSLLIARSASAQHQVAITFDDLPYVAIAGDTAAASVNQQIIAALVQHHVPATGFVIGERADTQVLDQWTRAGFALGNHTFSHQDLDQRSVADFEADVVRGEGAKRPTFFRFPYNHTGDTPEKHDAIAAFLRERGYRVAACTMTNDDFIFNAAYVRMLARHDSASAARLRTDYLAYTRSEVAYYAALDTRVWGREPPEVMLLHDNRLNADVIAQVLAIFEQAHYRFITLAAAESDAAYRAPDTFVSKFGPMWGYRWARMRNVAVDGTREPEPPAWISTYPGAAL